MMTFSRISTTTKEVHSTTFRREDTVSVQPYYSQVLKRKRRTDNAETKIDSKIYTQFILNKDLEDSIIDTVADSDLHVPLRIKKQFKVKAKVVKRQPYKPKPFIDL